MGYPQIIHFNGIFHYESSIWGYPPFMEPHIYIYISIQIIWESHRGEWGLEFWNIQFWDICAWPRMDFPALEGIILQNFEPLNSMKIQQQLVVWFRNWKSIWHTRTLAMFAFLLAMYTSWVDCLLLFLGNLDAFILGNVSMIHDHTIFWRMNIPFRKYFHVHQHITS